MQKHLLLVDDESELREIYADLLSDMGYKVSQAENGKVALEIISNQSIDLVISDIQMPKMSGILLLEEIQKNHKETPLIFITGHSDVQSKEAFEKGALGYFLKPLNIHTIEYRIKDLLGNGIDSQTIIKKEDIREKAKILISEDNPADQTLLKKAISQSVWNDHMETEFFDDGNQMLEHIKDSNASMPDLFLVDLNMPGFSGFDVLKEIKNSRPDIPVIVLTASSAEGDMLQAYELGADSFLVKPWKLEEWILLIESIAQNWVTKWYPENKKVA